MQTRTIFLLNATAAVLVGAFLYRPIMAQSSAGGSSIWIAPVEIGKTSAAIGRRDFEAFMPKLASGLRGRIKKYTYESSDGRVVTDCYEMRIVALDQTHCISVSNGIVSGVRQGTSGANSTIRDIIVKEMTEGGMQYRRRESNNNSSISWNREVYGKGDLTGRVFGATKVTRQTRNYFTENRSEYIGAVCVYKDSTIPSLSNFLKCIP